MIAYQHAAVSKKQWADEFWSAGARGLFYDDPVELLSFCNEFLEYRGVGRREGDVGGAQDHVVGVPQHRFPCRVDLTTGTRIPESTPNCFPLATQQRTLLLAFHEGSL